MWVQREHVVRPIGYHRVRQHRVGAEIGIGGGYQADLVAARRILRNVERVRRLGERGRVVVGISDLETKKKRRVSEISDSSKIRRKI